MIDKERLKACATLYGHQGVNYHLGAVDSALKEADKIASALGTKRIKLHNRLEQYAALAWNLNEIDMGKGEA